MKTVTPDTFTIATDDPAYAPWFIDNDPGNGQGFESAVGFRIAQHLGYEPSQVRWIRVPYTEAIAPGPKPFDIDLSQATITPERKASVDYSIGYYEVRQAVITYEGSPIADKTSVDQLRNAKLGAQAGSTSYAAILNQIQPSTEPASYATSDDAVQALRSHEVDGIVTDVPSAFYMSTAKVGDAEIIGQLPTTDDREQVGAVLAKGSPLTACINKAINGMRADGTLPRLSEQWLSAKRGMEQLS